LPVIFLFAQHAKRQYLPALIFHNILDRNSAHNLNVNVAFNAYRKGLA
jgi:hypothetical protein